MLLDESMAFAERLREIMLAHDVDQSEIARALGIRSQSVNQWSKGRTHPIGKRLEKLAAILRVTPADLVSDEGAPFSDLGISAIGRPAPWQTARKLREEHDKRAWLYLWDRMPDDTRHAVLAALDVVIPRRDKTG